MFLKEKKKKPLSRFKEENLTKIYEPCRHRKLSLLVCKSSACRREPTQREDNRSWL